MVLVRVHEPDVEPMDCEFIVPPPLEDELDVNSYIKIRPDWSCLTAMKPTLWPTSTMQPTMTTMQPTMQPTLR